MTWEPAAGMLSVRIAKFVHIMRNKTGVLAVNWLLPDKVR